MEQLQHPEITWAEETGYPSWAQEVLDDFDEDEELPEGAEISEFAEVVLSNIPFRKDRAVTRERLVRLTGIGDRQVRRAIEELRRSYVIINDQDGRGYYRSGDLNDISRAYYQERARALAVLRRLKPMRELLKGGGRL